MLCKHTILFFYFGKYLEWKNYKENLPIVSVLIIFVLQSLIHKMKKAILLAFFLANTIFKSMAQPTIDQNAAGSTSMIRFNNMPSNTYNVLEGSPYIPSEGFREGSVLSTGTNSKWFGGYNLRFNTYSAQLEMNESGVIKTISPDDVKGFKIGEATYFLGYPAVDKLSKNSYFQVLYNGKVKLLKNTSTYLREVRGFDDVKQGDKFVTDVYYYIFENETMTKFFPNKKAFFKAFPSAKLAAVEGFVNNKEFKFKAEGDFIETIRFYDSL